MKNLVLLAENQEYFSENSDKILFLLKFRISAQNRICLWGDLRLGTLLRYIPSSVSDRAMTTHCY